jgi:hypothetical protein
VRQRILLVTLIVLASVPPGVANAVVGGGGFGFVWAQPAGRFLRAADPTMALSLWVAAFSESSPWGMRAEMHFLEEHTVTAGVPDPNYVPAPGLTGPRSIPLYTDLFGVTVGPLVQGQVGGVPAIAWLAIGVDDVEPSYGIGYSGPYRFGDAPGAPGGPSFSLALGGAVRLFDRRLENGSGGIDLGVEYLAHPSASYLDRPPVKDPGVTPPWRTVHGSADTFRAFVGIGARGRGKVHDQAR